MSSRRRASFLVLAGALWLASCSGGGDDAEAKAGPEAQPSKSGHVWKAEVDAIAKARGVGAQLQGAADRQRQVIGN